MIYVLDNEREHYVRYWVEMQLGLRKDALFPGTAIGVALNGKMVCGVVYADHQEMPFGNDIRLNIAATDPRWATKKNIGFLLGFPFNQLGCRRVTAIVARSNKRCRRFIEGIGFVPEGRIRHGFDGRQHALVYGLLKEEAARWLCREECPDNRQIIAQSAGRA